ncbi:hypothetical protein MMYC01_205190 [Madurella mycetomatis]|uniref:Centrosomin N-terminal motif 1 domain-containing protein n=1 Tax=Madurella mycetomatis TaxID=100816 RepID=A0A175WB49_9PEZI|nr:hypothetical protein MMYC01_205190 [Madurella mycetomatis]
MSSLLHERLQRERRAASTDLLNTAMQSRAVRSPSPADSQRPGSSGGAPVPGRRKGWTIKEMEHTLSTLHKQNFDLKLELFHRREKQTAMEERLAMFEERLEMLEKEKIESAKKNDQLASELEKRDKAVEEAVTIIVALESRLESLLREKETVRKMEPDSSSLTRIGSPAQAPSTNVTKSEPFNTGEPKSLNRMPSFVSDRSDNTQNLRSVYLGAREPSLVSLPRTEGTPNTTHIHYQLASPVPSVLSESSFVSVYGRNRTIGGPAADDSPLSAEAPCLDRKLVVSEDTPTKAPRPISSRAARSEAGQFHNIGVVLDIGRSPLQRLEKLKMAPAALSYSPRASTPPPTSSNNTDQSPFAKPAKARKEKRETLHKVLTQGPFNNEQQSKGLPPTPDTLSTTTLHAQEPTPTGEMANGRHSPASSIDPWMCESFRPASVDHLDPMSSVSQANSGARPGRVSPDLFSFPSSTSGWAADAMFGSLGGAGFMGAGGKTSPVVPMAPMANMVDAIGRSVPPGRSSSERLTANLEPATAAPAPPNRRSSLLARTGLLDTDTVQVFDSTPQPASSTASSFKRSPARGNKVRSNSNTDLRPASRHLADVMGPRQDRAMTVPPKQVHQPPPTQQTPQSQAPPKQRHYPPTASQASRPRSRGLNGFFRRSTGSSHGTPFAAPPSAPPAQPTPKSPSVPLVGVPSCVRRSPLATDDERSSVTPPPILRKKPIPVLSQTSGRVDYDEDGGAALSTGAAEYAENGGAPVGNSGGKRKWLSLGRGNLLTRGI